MQEASHHGHVIREYRESKAGITQDELARQVGKSRRTIVSIEQSACINDLKLRRTLAGCRREQRAVRPVVMRLSASFMVQARTTERSEGASEIGPGMVTE